MFENRLKCWAGGRHFNTNDLSNYMTRALGSWFGSGNCMDDERKREAEAWV
jgi:hypothetical protein